MIVLPNESQEEFDQLVEQFQKDFYPKDAVKMMLVNEMAVITWKKLRLEKLERDYCTRQLEAQISLEEFLSINPQFTDKTNQFWINTGGIKETAAERLTKIIDYIKPFRCRNMTVSQLKYIKTNFDSVYSWILTTYEQITPLASGEPTLAELVAKKVRQNNVSESYLVPYCVEKMLEHFEAGLQCVKFSGQIEDGIIQIRQERLLKMIQLGEVQRASDDLNRAMIRTVGEYRKHHEWRIQNRTQQLPDGDTKQLTAE